MGLHGAGNGPSKSIGSQSSEGARTAGLSAIVDRTGALSNSKGRFVASERRSAAFWWMFIFALMAINLGVAGMAVYMAVGDPSFRPLPNYSQDAIDWQVRKDRQVASDRLGWRATYERSLNPLGVVVKMVDRDGQALAGQGTLHAYHFTRVAEHRSAELKVQEGKPGEYFAELDVARDGKWQLSLEFRHDGDDRSVFVQEIQQNWEGP